MEPVDLFNTPITTSDQDFINDMSPLEPLTPPGEDEEKKEMTGLTCETKKINEFFTKKNQLSQHIQHFLTCLDQTNKSRPMVSVEPIRTYLDSRSYLAFTGVLEDHYAKLYTKAFSAIRTMEAINRLNSIHFANKQFIDMKPETGEVLHGLLTLQKHAKDKDLSSLRNKHIEVYIRTHNLNK